MTHRAQLPRERTLVVIGALLCLAWQAPASAQQPDTTATEPKVATAVIAAAPESLAAKPDSAIAEDAHPQDSPAERGFLLVTGDGRASLRLRGSVRLNGAYDLNGLETDAFSTLDIPTGEANRSEPRFFMSATQTRIGLEASRTLESGNAFARIEADFRGTNGSFRIRHAYAQLNDVHWGTERSDQVLGGQTWSTFSDVEAIPPTVDLDGPNSAVGERTTKIRYRRTRSDRLRWDVALESPRPDVATTDSVAAEPAFQSIPDIAASIRRTGKRAEIQVAGIFRGIAVRGASGEVDYLVGAGGLLSGHIRPGGRSELLFQFVGGAGISRYITALQGRGLDAIYDPTAGHFVLLPSMGGFVSFGRTWKMDVATYLTVGNVTIFNKDFEPGSAFNFSAYVSANCFWNMTEGTRAGVEYSYGTRVNKDDSSGHANRFSFIFYYDF